MGEFEQGEMFLFSNDRFDEERNFNLMVKVSITHFIPSKATFNEVVIIRVSLRRAYFLKFAISICKIDIR